MPRPCAAVQRGGLRNRMTAATAERARHEPELHRFAIFLDDAAVAVLSIDHRCRDARLPPHVRRRRCAARPGVEADSLRIALRSRVMAKSRSDVRVRRSVRPRPRRVSIRARGLSRPQPVTTDPPRSTDPLLDDPAPLLPGSLSRTTRCCCSRCCSYSRWQPSCCGGREIGPGTLWFEASLVAVALLFCAGFWTRGGQTLGMRAWRMVDCGGRRPDHLAARLWALLRGLVGSAPLRARLLVGAVRLTPPLLARHTVRHARGARATARLTRATERDERHEQQHRARRPRDDDRIEIEHLTAAPSTSPIT